MLGRERAVCLRVVEGSRLRWKIENEGFNVQKNGGCGPEHAYTQNATAVKVFYFLLQIARLLIQLMTHGSLFRHAFPQGVGPPRTSPCVCWRLGGAICA